MEQYIPKSALVAEIERRIKNLYPKVGQGMIITKILKDHYEDLVSFIDTLEVIEVDISSVSENLAEADEYLDYTSTGNLAHNKPMVNARLRRAIKELYNAKLFKLTHDEKYRIERLGLKAQKGEEV